LHHHDPRPGRTGAGTGRWPGQGAPAQGRPDAEPVLEPFPDTLKPAEKIVYWTILLTWPFYAIGALYVVGPVLAWSLAGFAAFALYLAPVMRADLAARMPPWIVWLSFAAMAGMLVVLWIGQHDHGFGTGRMIKSTIGWAKGWALFPLYMLIGACLFIRMEVIVRAYCVLGLHTLILVPLFILAPGIGLPETVFTSPLKVVGGPGPEYFTVFLYTIDPANGMPRWQFFAPWSPFAGLIGVITVLCALEEKNRFWLVCGLLAGIAMVLMTKSRMSVVGVVVCVGVPRLLPLMLKPWAYFVAASVAASMVVVGDSVVAGVSDARTYFREMRANSTRVRDALKRIAKERWASEAYWFGHGTVEPGSHVTEYMLIGTHHTWYGLLFVRGMAGAILFAVPIVALLVALTLRVLCSPRGYLPLGVLLSLLLVSFGGNLETQFYIVWPALVILGAGLAEAGRDDAG